MTRVLVFAFAILLAGCATLPAGSDIANSWEQAQVYVPGQPAFVRPLEDRADKPYPVMIFLHGCNGITDYNDVAWAKYFQAMGYIVVLPDSFARRDRHESCSGYQYYGTMRVHTARVEDPRSHARRQSVSFAAIPASSNQKVEGNAVPARIFSTNLRGLPLAYMVVGEYDLLSGITEYDLHRHSLFIER